MRPTILALLVLIGCADNPAAPVIEPEDIILLPDVTDEWTTVVSERVGVNEYESHRLFWVFAEDGFYSHTRFNVADDELLWSEKGEWELIGNGEPQDGTLILIVWEASLSRFEGYCYNLTVSEQGSFLNIGTYMFYRRR